MYIIYLPVTDSITDIHIFILRSQVASQMYIFLSFGHRYHQIFTYFIFRSQVPSQIYRLYPLVTGSNTDAHICILRSQVASQMYTFYPSDTGSITDVHILSFGHRQHHRCTHSVSRPKAASHQHQTCLCQEKTNAKVFLLHIHVCTDITTSRDPCK